MCCWVLIPAKKSHIRIEASVVYSTRNSLCDYTNVKNYSYRETEWLYNARGGILQVHIARKIRLAELMYCEERNK
jgi:hypothetical protein